MELSVVALEQIAEYFKVLSEVSRLQVLCALKDGEKNVTEIMAITELGQANVSKHLKILTQAGLVTRQPRGVNVYYRVTDPKLFELCEVVCQMLKQRLEERSGALTNNPF
jgi:DNA-binding transcriptional ArsR family regulator